jgi:hypothetical protein
MEDTIARPHDRVPYPVFLKHPRSGGVFEGRSLLFIWDFGDVFCAGARYRFVIKKRFANQSAEEAFWANPTVIETDVSFVQFLVLDVIELGKIESDFVWRVSALGAGPEEDASVLAQSEVRIFLCTHARNDLSLMGVRIPPRLPVEPPGPKPKVPKGKPPQACPNGDLETGTFQNWQGFYGNRTNQSSIYLNALQQGFLNGRHTIVAAGADPYMAGKGVTFAQVSEGNYAARLGNSAAGGDADLLAYTFTVTAQNQYFPFRYALVLEDGGHAASEQPYFCYYVVRGPSIFWTSSNLPVIARQVVAESSPFFKQVGDIVYRDWTPTCLDLSPYLGQTMTIVFGVTDCAQGGHFGYAYVDGLCVSSQAIASFVLPPVVCASADLWADGSASTGETSHFWSIEESDANWGRQPQTEVYDWFVAKQAGPINLTALYASKGGAFKCNTYYRIKLAVTNDCTPWNESVQLILVRCPQINAGPDACVSCKPNGQSVQLGTGSNHPTPGYIYSWTPSVGLSDPNLPRPYHAQGSVPYPITYTLTVTDDLGCAASDQVTLYCRPPSVTVDMVVGCCSVTLLAHANNYSSLTWSTGQSGVQSIEVTQAGTYSVTVTNACGSRMQTIVVPATIGLSGPFNPVAAEGHVGSSPYSNEMHIKDVVIGSPAGIAGVPHAYNATDYRLQIFDRWGQVIRTIADSNCDGFNNWDIRWDTTDNWGASVPQGAYTWRLELKNCHHDWSTPDVRRFKKRHCVRWWINIFGVQLFCREWDVPDGTTEDVPGGIDSVVVVR